MLDGKTLLNYTDLLSPNDYKKTSILSISKINMAEEASLAFRLRKFDETRDYLLEEIKHNDLISEKYKKTCKYLHYVENLLILVSTVTGCISISTFISLVRVPVSITSSALVLKFVQSLQELKSKRQLSRKSRKSMIK